MAKIESEEDLRQWLMVQDRQVALAIVARAALRAIPFANDFLQERIMQQPQLQDRYMLPVMKANCFAWASIRQFSQKGHAPPPYD